MDVPPCQPNDPRPDFRRGVRPATNVKGTDNYNDVAGMTLSEQVALAGGYKMIVSRNVPKMLQFDYLTGLQRMFNLVFIQDRLRRITSY